MLHFRFPLNSLTSHLRRLGTADTRYIAQGPSPSGSALAAKLVSVLVALRVVLARVQWAPVHHRLLRENRSFQFWGNQYETWGGISFYDVDGCLSF